MAAFVRAAPLSAILKSTHFIAENLLFPVVKERKNWYTVWEKLYQSARNKRKGDVTCLKNHTDGCCPAC